MIAILCALAFSQLKITLKAQKIILSLLFLIACVLPVKNIIQGYNPKYVNFIRSVDWLNKNAVNGSLLAVDDIGILGYYYNKGKLVDAPWIDKSRSNLNI